MEGFSCDLAQNARKHKGFLTKIHELGVSVAPPSVTSLYRYRHLWLNLLYNHQDGELIPPPDVAWLWHCHRLAPKEYMSYVSKTFGVMLETNPPFTLQCSEYEYATGSAAERTRLLWSESYPNEPFFLNKDDIHGGQVAAPPRRDLNAEGIMDDFDLLGSTERQAAFLWQVSGERFQDDNFLEEGVQNYAKFLKLMPKAASQFLLVPTYQIDLMWHTHILTSITDYNNDCMALMGRTLHHDDSLTDRSDGGVLDVSFTATTKLWKSEYGSDYVVPGGMYRGEPPKEFFHADWNSSDDVAAGGNWQHLIGKIGASSTSPPTKWADTKGLASDGKPAFIPTNTTKRTDLKANEYKENYVLGKTAKTGVGYYHIETKEANRILYTRVRRRHDNLEQSIAVEKCCCGAPEDISKKEKELIEMKKSRDVLRDRVAATEPSRVSRNTATHATYYGDGGVWFYPVGLYDCAGGACGGDAACAGGGCGGAACGGGGCGGGGCGGGGCGG